MPDERDLPEEFDSDQYDDENDVPFKLPRSSEVDAETDEPPSRSAHKMVTMPVFREPGVPDPKATLPGSGGLDPNPDFTTPAEHAGKTAPHPAVRMPQQVDPTPAQQPYQRPAQPHTPQPAYIPPMPPAQTGGPQQGARPLPRRRRARKVMGMPRGCLWIFIGAIVSFCGGLSCLTVAAAAIFIPRVEEQWTARVAQVDSYRSFQSTFIYDRYGDKLWEAFGEGRRTDVKYSDFPQFLIDATVATEDKSFFSNVGIDVPATTVAFLRYLGASNDQETAGGSTITQQLVRNVLFPFEYRAERSVQRKVEEILLAILLTQRKSKQEILQLYLNEIYYGNLAYGAEAAAETFFGKHVGELTLGEAALLAGLPQAPADLDPLNPDPAVQDAVYARWRDVLDQMVDENLATPAQRDDALRQGLNFVPPQVSLIAPHFTVYAQQELERLMSSIDYNNDGVPDYTAENIANGGLKVYTTVDLRVNNLVQQAVREQVSRLASNDVTNGAAVVIQPITGEIVAMVGSVDYNNDAIDGRVNVTISLRQPGSAMKPFTYSAAMEQGMTPGDVIWDTPTRIGIPGQAPYVPVDYDGTFHGPVRMRHALANSYNIPAVQTLRRVGVDYLLSLMQRFGAESLGTDASRYGLSLTLGGGEISPVELTQAYAVFANQGVLVPVTSILCIVDRDDNIIYQYENSCPGGRQTERTVNRMAVDVDKQALDPRIAFIIRDILADNNARSAAMGGNSVLRTDGIYSSVKTGTTNDFKDNWTVGFTSNVAIGVWTGNSNGDPMRGVSGLAGAAPIWNAIINGIYGNQDLLAAFAIGGQLLPDQIAPPAGLSLRRLCDVRTLMDPALSCNASQAEWFLDGPPGIPDAEGNLYYPQVQGQLGNQQPGSGPWVQTYEPGIYRVLVHPIPPEIAAGITFNIPGGQPAPPPPIYCQVPVEMAGSAPGAQEQLFIAPPPVPDDAVAAEKYARDRGLAFLPTIACTPELLTAQNFGPQVVTAVIVSPTPNQVVQGSTPIIGTVQFSPDQAQFYKLEIKGGQFPDWVTIGSTHGESVVNGQLETLYAPALTSGDYQLRLVLVDWTGGFLQAPYIVPFRVP